MSLYRLDICVSLIDSNRTDACQVYDVFVKPLNFKTMVIRNGTCHCADDDDAVAAVDGDAEAGSDDNCWFFGLFCSSVEESSVTTQWLAIKSKTKLPRFVF